MSQLSTVADLEPWQELFELLSLPCLPPIGATIHDLFNDDIEGEYFDGNTGTWIVFTWDPSLFDYVNPNTNAPVLTLPNLIGNPYDQPVTSFDDVQVTTTKGVCSMGGGD